MKRVMSLYLISKKYIAVSQIVEKRLQKRLCLLSIVFVVNQSSDVNFIYLNGKNLCLFQSATEFAADISITNKVMDELQYKLSTKIWNNLASFAG